VLIKLLVVTFLGIDELMVKRLSKDDAIAAFELAHGLGKKILGFEVVIQKKKPSTGLGFLNHCQADLSRLTSHPAQQT